MPSIKQDMEELSCDLADMIHEGLTSGNYSRLKTIGLELLPVFTGAAVGGIARLTGKPELVAAPLGIELLFGTIPTHSPRAMSRVAFGYFKYAVGAALPYMDQVYLAAHNLADKF